MTDKIITIMATYIFELNHDACPGECGHDCPYEELDDCSDKPDNEVIECWIAWFTKQAEEK